MCPSGDDRIRQGSCCGAYEPLRVRGEWLDRHLVTVFYDRDDSSDRSCSLPCRRTRAPSQRDRLSLTLVHMGTGKQTSTAKKTKSAGCPRSQLSRSSVGSPIRCSRQDAKWSQAQPRISHPSLDAPPLPLWKDRRCLQLEHTSTLSLWSTTKTTCVPITLSAFLNGGSHQRRGI